MKIIAILAMGVVAACGGDLTVYVQDLSNPSAAKLGRAEALANEIFTGASVKIDWRNGEPKRARLKREKAMVVEMVSGTPTNKMPGALAYALPYEGVHITVFYDRVQQAAEFTLSPNDLLAHVLVHEITHLLEGITRHSKTGIMKPHWTLDDVRGMRHRPLEFTEEDEELIRLGLVRRDSGEALLAAGPAAAY
jgi:hypothetical protein